MRGAPVASRGWRSGALPSSFPCPWWSARDGDRGGLRSLVAAATVLAGAVGCAGVPTGADPNQVIIDAVTRLLPAVVDLEVFATGPAVRVLGRERHGSGVVVSADGHILTVSNVVTGAEKLNVTFHDGRRISGGLTATDPETGLALIHVTPFPGMVVAPLTSSATLRLGQACVVVASQGRSARTVSAGVISGFPSFEGYWEYRLERVVQTDAVINPGSSGGPLADAQGRVVGILSLSQSDLERANFAIPAELVAGVLDEMIQHGQIRSRVVRPWLGTYTVSVDGGVGVVAVLPGGPAERAGLRQRDVILQVNGVPVESRGAFYQVVWQGKVGDPFELIVRREDESLTLMVQGEDRRSFFLSPLQERKP
jgi:serine protease Do